MVRNFLLRYGRITMGAVLLCLAGPVPVLPSAEPAAEPVTPRGLRRGRRHTSQCRVVLQSQTLGPVELRAGDAATVHRDDTVEIIAASGSRPWIDLRSGPGYRLPAESASFQTSTASCRW